MSKWKPFKSAGEVISKIGSQKNPEKSKHFALYEQALAEINNSTSPKAVDLGRLTPLASTRLLSALKPKTEGKSLTWTEDDNDTIFDRWGDLIEDQYQKAMEKRASYSENYDWALKTHLAEMDLTIENLLKSAKANPKFSTSSESELRAELERIKEDIAEYFADGEAMRALEY